MTSSKSLTQRPGTGPAQLPLALPTTDNRYLYRRIRNYLAGQALGSTRDEVLLRDVVKTLFCRHWMETQDLNLPSGTHDIAKAYHKALLSVSRQMPDLFDPEEGFDVDDQSLIFIHESLVDVDLDDPTVDLVGDAYEAFIGAGIRGQDGQFFTPQNAVALLLDLVRPEPGELIFDPACGAGGFLSAAARRMAARRMLSSEAVKTIYGHDKDRYLARLAATRLAFASLHSANVFCADSLAWRSEDGRELPTSPLRGNFDVILTNPPFGSKIIAASADVQRKYDLGYSWKYNSRTGSYAKLSSLTKSVPPQVLFLELCISLVKPGGRIGIVVPESLISGSNYRHVVNFIRRTAEIRAVVGMPEALFKTSGKSGTHTKTCLLYLQRHVEDGASQPTRIFMAEARWCGNDSRGRRTSRDELPVIAERYAVFLRDRPDLGASDHQGYSVQSQDIVEDVLAPRYYNPDIAAELEALRPTHELIPVSDLLKAGVVTITTGNEIGAIAYGSGDIPFVRTSDISNWEIKLDPKHGVNEEVYNLYASKQDVREGDILMVRDGTYLIGTCAYVTKFDTRILFQSHLYKIRVNNHDAISPFLLLAALSSAPVRRQVRAKRFTQDIIDSLGKRINELVLPLPKDLAIRRRVESMVRRSINERVEARELARQACLELVGTAVPTNEDDE
jgi:type I restriction enzyme M protein